MILFNNTKYYCPNCNDAVYKCQCGNDHPKKGKNTVLQTCLQEYDGRKGHWFLLCKTTDPNKTNKTDICAKHWFEESNDTKLLHWNAFDLNQKYKVVIDHF